MFRFGFTQIPAHKMHILKLRQPFIKPQLVSLNDITPKKLFQQCITACSRMASE